MIDPILFIAFIPAALALNMTPGADMLFCLAQGLRGGARPAIAASAGISTGGMVHAMLAGLGLGALVAAFPWVFGAIRWIGVIYLVWLAWKTLTTPLVAKDLPNARPARAFLDGMIVNLSNPKVILFILAFVPQFVTPESPVFPQFLIYGLVLAVGGFAVNGLVGVFASGIGKRFLSSARAERNLRYVTASIFGALAARIGWEAART